ncbi:hypothetical protein MNEG_9011, partial [Monoraphidium neglectum]
MILVLAAAAAVASRVAAAGARWKQREARAGARIERRAGVDILHPTSSGYLTASQENGSELFYVFFEAEEPEGDLETTPIVLWLQ